MIPRVFTLLFICCAGAQAATVSGTWSGQFLGHDAVLELKERADGSVVGFLPTDPNARVGNGLVSGSNLSLHIVVSDPGYSAAGTLAGVITGHQFNGMFTLGGVATPVTLARASSKYGVEYWVMGEEDIQSRVLRLNDKKGDFVSGGYVGIDSCDFLTCAGDITAWDITGAAHDLTTQSGGACAASANLSGLWSAPDLLLAGSYNLADCGGASAGTFIGGKGGLTDGKSLQGVLKLLADFADRVQAESFTALDLISDSYLNDGKTKANWQSDLSELYNDYNNLSLQVAAVDEVVTANDAEVNPMILLPPRVGWRLVVTGTPTGGGPLVTVSDITFSLSGNQQLYQVGKEQGRYVFTGNGYAAPFAIELPIDSIADSAHTVYGLWPFGVHGGGHPEGHPGWDIEYVAGAQVRAAADGTITQVEPNDGNPGQFNVTINHRPGASTRYDHVTNLQPGITEGAVVAVGDPLGDPGTFPPGFQIVHFALLQFTDPVCPSAALSPGAQALFDSIWTDATYGEELTEPYPCNPESASFPLTRLWQRSAGALAPRIEFTRAAPASSAYSYILRDAGNAIIETGSATIDVSTAPPSIDLVPAGGGATHLGVYHVVSGQMLIDWDDAVRPPDLAGASSYTSDP